MYINFDGNYEVTEKTKKVANNQFEIFWEGLLFFSGVLEGNKSAEFLLQNLSRLLDADGTINIVDEAYGSGVIFINNKTDNSWFVTRLKEHTEFIYFTDNAVSNSFLKLREKEVSNKYNIDDSFIASVISSGRVYSENNGYTGIRRLGITEYLHIKDQTLNIGKHNKNWKVENDQKKINYVSAMDKMFNSLREHKICSDLTGGVDSRSIVICMDHLGYDFDVATNGDHNFIEVKVAGDIARILNKKHIYRDLHIEEIDRDELKKAWENCDGLSCNIGSSLFEKWRKQFGYTIVVGGSSGELYKDSGFYHRALLYFLKRRNQRQFINDFTQNGVMHWGAMSTKEFNDIVSEKYQNTVIDLRNNTRHFLLSQYEHYPLLELADRLFHEFSTDSPGGTGNNIINRFMPLQEPCMIQVGNSQPPYMRVCHLLYRKHVGKHNIKAARVKTDWQDASLSPAFTDLIIDYYKYLTIFINRNKGLHNLEAPNQNKAVLEKYIKSHEDTKIAVQFLKDAKVLSESFNVEKSSTEILSRLVTLYYLSNS